MSLLEFDLDHAPLLTGSGEPARTSPTRLVSLLVAAALVAAISGAVLRSTSFGSTDAPPAPVAARLSAGEVTLAPEPTITMRLEVSSAAVDLRLDRIDLSGGGIPRLTLRLDAAVPAGGSLGLDLEAPLACRPFGDPDLRATLRLREADAGALREVGVVVSGPLHGDGGGCALARGTLPDGWPAPVTVVDAQVRDGVLTVQLAELEPGRRVQGVFADGTLLSPAPGSHPADVLAMLPPLADCRALAGRPVLPAGLRLLVSGGPEGLVSRYAAVGPVLSRWLRSAYAGQCDGGRG